MISNIAIQLVGDAYIVRCVFDRTRDNPAPSEQVIYVPIEAIAHRREFYGCQSDEEALELILKEHYVRLNGGDQSPPPDPATGQRKRWEELTPDERRKATGVDRPILVAPIRLPRVGGPNLGGRNA